jgi:hypothetical protein
MLIRSDLFKVLVLLLIDTVTGVLIFFLIVKYF